MKKLLPLLLLFVMGTSIQAQLPDGSFVPNFEAVDINGETQNLYDLLAQGYKVVIDVSATWCGPCWDYHLTGALEDLHHTYGPDGTKEIFVLFIEGDDSTTYEDLIGTGPATIGDWTLNTPYPIIDNGGFIADLLEIEYYPTIYMVCSNATIYETERLSTQEHYDFAQRMECQSLENDAAVSTSANPEADCDGIFDSTISLINVGETGIENATILVNGCENCPLEKEWNGSLAYLESTEITFENIEVLEGSTNLTFAVNNSDENLGNNVAQREVISGFVPATNTWTIELMTDCYPEESSWTVENEAGEIVAEGSAYEAPTTLITETFELPANGCYTLTFYDSYGDGLNGSAEAPDCTVDGSFKAYTDSGEILFNDGSDQFSYILNNALVEGVSSLNDIDVSSQLVVSPNPATDFVNIDYAQNLTGTIQIEILNSTGKRMLVKNMESTGGSLNTNLNVSHLNSGLYLITIRSEDGEVIQKFIKE